MARAIVPGLGWLVLAMPWILLVLVCGMLLARFVHISAVLGLRIVSLGGVVAVPLLVLHPLARLSVIATAATPHHAVARVINAGLLPVRVSLKGAHAVISSGQAVTLSAFTRHAGLAPVSASASLGALGWAVVGVVVIAPIPLAFATLYRSGAPAAICA